MALIGKIRKNSWLLIVLIGVGLLSFIVMDMTSGQQSVFGGGQTTMANVEGEKIDWFRFSNTERVLYQGVTGDPYARREQLYNFFVEKVLVEKESDKLGLDVSKEELLDLQFGAQPSPIIRARFSDPQAPGQINRQQLNQIKQIIESTGALAYTSGQAKKHAAIARQSLDGLPVSEYRTALAQLADFSVSRTF